MIFIVCYFQQQHIISILLNFYSLFLKNLTDIFNVGQWMNDFLTVGHIAPGMEQTNDLLLLSCVLKHCTIGYHMLLEGGSWS